MAISYTEKNSTMKFEDDPLIKRYLKYRIYLNQKTNDDYAKKGLYNTKKTSEILDIANTTIARYRDSGVLKEGEHYFAGDHYFHRYMYDPEKNMNWRF